MPVPLRALQRPTSVRHTAPTVVHLAAYIYRRPSRASEREYLVVPLGIGRIPVTQSPHRAAERVAPRLHRGFPDTPVHVEARHDRRNSSVKRVSQSALYSHKPILVWCEEQTVVVLGQTSFPEK